VKSNSPSTKRAAHSLGLRSASGPREIGDPYRVAIYDGLAAELQLKPASSGANVWIFTPGDDGIYYGAQNVGDVAVVSNVQLYLDLINFKGRGEEQAAAIRQQLLGY